MELTVKPQRPGSTQDLKVVVVLEEDPFVRGFVDVLWVVDHLESRPSLEEVFFGFFEVVVEPLQENFPRGQHLPVIVPSSQESRVVLREIFGMLLEFGVETCRPFLGLGFFWVFRLFLGIWGRLDRFGLFVLLGRIG